MGKEKNVFVLAVFLLAGCTVYEGEKGIAFFSDYKEPKKEEGSFVYLSDIQEVYSRQDESHVKKDFTFQGNIISLNNGVFEKGLGTNANSEIQYDVRVYKRFESWIGLDDELDMLFPNYASVVFKVLLDGKVVFESDVFRQESPPKFITVSLNNAHKMTLIVDDADTGSPEGNLIWGDHANWADAKLIK